MVNARLQTAADHCWATLLRVAIQQRSSVAAAAQAGMRVHADMARHHTALEATNFHFCCLGTPRTCCTRSHIGMQHSNAHSELPPI